MKPLVPLLALFLTGCTTALPPLKTVENVDLPRFMGPWYVIACIPTFIETEAYNAIEEYRLQPDGTIQTIFTFNHLFCRFGKVRVSFFEIVLISLIVTGN